MIIVLLKSINLRFSENSFTTNHALKLFPRFLVRKRRKYVLEMGESIVQFSEMGLPTNKADFYDTAARDFLPPGF
jgi:hypothetical protein